MPPEHHLTQALRLLQQSRQRVAIYLSRKNYHPTPEDLQVMQTLHEEYMKAGHYTKNAVRVMRVFIH